MGDSEKEITSSKASIDEVTVEELAARTAKPAKAGKKSDKVGFFTALKSEFKKIIWPNRQSLTRQTVAVVLSSVALGVVITVVDIIIRFGLELIVK